MKKDGIAILTKWSEGVEPLFEKIGNLTKVQRIMISCLSVLLLVGAFVYFIYLPKSDQIKQLDSQYKSLKTQLTDAKNKAAKLESYREKMKAAQAEFNIAMKALPNKEEIPSLLEGISRSGQQAGLDFLLFQPKSEAVKDFYAEIPVSIKVNGTYHQLAVFFDKVSRLSRIVNIRDIDLKASKKSSELQASCTAVTYKFVETQKTTKNRKNKKKR